MSKKIASAHVDISAKTKGFSSGVDKAKNSLNGLASKLPGMNSGLAKLAMKFTGMGPAGLAVAGGLAAATAAATAAAAGFAMLGKAVLAQFAPLDALGKHARVVGLFTDELANLQNLAGLSGVGNINDAIQKMNASLANASVGTSRATDALNTLGISVESIMGMSGADQLGLIADRINAVGNASMKAKIAADIFGRGNVDMINLLASGSKGIQANAEKLKEWGYALSTTQVAGIEIANDAMSDFKTRFVGVLRSMAATIAPYLAVLYRAFGKAFDRIRKIFTMSEGDVNKWSDHFAKMMELLIDGLQGLAIFTVQVFKDIASVLSLFPGLDVFDSVSAKLQALENDMKKSDWHVILKHMLRDVRGEMDALNESTEKQRAMQKEFAEQQARMERRKDADEFMKSQISDRDKDFMERGENWKKAVELFKSGDITREGLQIAWQKNVGDFLNERQEAMGRARNIGRQRVRDAANAKFGSPEEWAAINEAKKQIVPEVVVAKPRQYQAVQGMGLGTQQFMSTMAEALNGSQDPLLRETRRQTGYLKKMSDNKVITVNF